MNNEQRKLNNKQWTMINETMNSDQWTNEQWTIALLTINNEQ